MHISIVVVVIFIAVAHATRSLDVQETEVSETGSGQEL